MYLCSIISVPRIGDLLTKHLNSPRPTNSATDANKISMKQSRRWHRWPAHTGAQGLSWVIRGRNHACAHMGHTGLLTFRRICLRACPHVHSSRSWKYRPMWLKSLHLPRPFSRPAASSLWLSLYRPISALVAGLPSPASRCSAKTSSRLACLSLRVRCLNTSCSFPTAYNPRRNNPVSR